MILIIIAQALLILLLWSKLSLYKKFYKTQMKLNNLNDKEKRINKL